MHDVIRELINAVQRLGGINDTRGLELHDLVTEDEQASGVVRPAAPAVPLTVDEQNELDRLQAKADAANAAANAAAAPPAAAPAGPSGWRAAPAADSGAGGPVG